MCDIWKLTEAQEITAAELERHLADIERLGVEWVVFTGGEPLMHSDLFRLSALLRDRGIRTTILSTGLLLERNAARIVESTDEVIVSLDGPAEDSRRDPPRARRIRQPGQRRPRRASHRAGVSRSARAAPCRRATPLTCAPRCRLPATWAFARSPSWRPT